MTVSSGRENCFDANMQYTSLVQDTFIRLGRTISVFVIVSMALGKVRCAVVQFLLSLKFFHSLGVYPCSFRLCVCVAVLQGCIACSGKKTI